LIAMIVNDSFICDIIVSSKEYKRAFTERNPARAFIMQKRDSVCHSNQRHRAVTPVVPS
jgi:hypothetical protein